MASCAQFPHWKPEIVQRVAGETTSETCLTAFALQVCLVMPGLRLGSALFTCVGRMFESAVSLEANEPVDSASLEALSTKL